jgi:hypothetical protein
MIENKNFSFDKDTHTYRLNGKPLTGVTAIIGIINKPWLVAWAAKTTVEYIKQNAEKIYDSDSKLTAFRVTDELLEQAKNSHRQISRAAADIGTKVHEFLEKYINAKINNSNSPISEQDIKHITDNFINWTTYNKVKFLESEKQVYSEKYWYAGTCDLVFEINNEKYIGDIKTSAGISPEMFWQIAGYDICLSENQPDLYQDIKGYMIINCRKNGEFVIERSYGRQSNQEVFLACLKIYKLQQELNNIIK